jgi:hypothetical protein
MAALHRSAWKDCRSRRRSYPTRWRFALNATSLHVVGNCADPINRVPLFIWTPRARTQNEHRRLWPTRVRGIGPPATAPEIGSARRCLLESPVPEHLRSTPECQRPAVDPHPRREPRTDNPPCQTGTVGVPTLPRSGRRPRRRPALVPPRRSLRLGDTPRYFGGWNNSKAVAKAKARASIEARRVAKPTIRGGAEFWVNTGASPETYHISVFVVRSSHVFRCVAPHPWSWTIHQ